MIRKFHKFIIIVTCIIFFTSLFGCFNYKEINKITFATSVIFDIDELDNIIVYIDCVRPYRSVKLSSLLEKLLILEIASEAVFPLL